MVMNGKAGGYSQDGCTTRDRAYIRPGYDDTDLRTLKNIEYSGGCGNVFRVTTVRQVVKGDGDNTGSKAKRPESA